MNENKYREQMSHHHGTNLIYISKQNNWRCEQKLVTRRKIILHEE